MAYLIALISLFIVPLLSDECSSNLVWTSSNNKLYLNGNEFKMKGLSWFGFETDTYIPHGLATWSNGGNSYTNLLDFVANNGFNAIRLPFSQDMVENNPQIDSWQIDASGNSIFSGKSALDCMDIIIEAAADRGLLIMLDFHSKSAGAYTQGMNDIDLTSAKNTWIKLAQRYKDQWNIFMADMYNEPHDVGNYNQGSKTYRWDDYISWVEEMAEAMIDVGVNWLFGVQGTNADCNSIRYGSTYCYWGENLQGVYPKDTSQARTVSLSVSNRFVWLPHVYGPEISDTGGYGASIWQDHWAYLCDGTYSANEAACIVGEFGAKSVSGWMTTFVNYLIDIDARNSYFWCLNPDSGDTGGLLQDDWSTEETAKLALLATLQPSPTSIYVSGSQICTGESSSGGGGGGSDPTPKPTPSPSSSSSGGGSSGNILITNKNGLNEWWYAVVISNVPNDYTITSVKMQDGHMSSWESGTSEWDYWKFTANGPYSAPFSFKITGTKNSASSTITSYNVISTINEGDSGYMSSSLAFTYDDDTESNGLHWTATFAIVMVGLIIAGAIICGVCYFKRRKTVIVAGTEDSEEKEIGNDNTEKDGYDMSPINTTGGDTQIENNNDNDNEEDLEIDVEMETTMR